MGGRWWVEEYTAVPDPIDADTDFCFDTCTEASDHGQPWAVISHPAAYQNGPVPGLFIVAGHRSDAVYYLASETPVRDEDRRIWFAFY